MTSHPFRLHRYIYRPTIAVAVPALLISYFLPFLLPIPWNQTAGQVIPPHTPPTVSCQSGRSQVGMRSFQDGRHSKQGMMGQPCAESRDGNRSKGTTSASGGDERGRTAVSPVAGGCTISLMRRHRVKSRHDVIIRHGRGPSPGYCRDFTGTSSAVYRSLSGQAYAKTCIPSRANPSSPNPARPSRSAKPHCAHVHACVSSLSAALCVRGHMT